MTEPNLYDLAKAYVAAVDYDEAHPETASSEWDVEMCIDQLRKHLAPGSDDSELLKKIANLIVVNPPTSRTQAAQRFSKIATALDHEEWIGHRYAPDLGVIPIAGRKLKER